MLVVKESRTSPMTLPTIKGSKGILAIVRGRNKEEERRGSGAKEGRNTIVKMNPTEKGSASSIFIMSLTVEEFN